MRCASPASMTASTDTAACCGNFSARTSHRHSGPMDRPIRTNCLLEQNILKGQSRRIVEG
jgi:hypothetical protein